MESNAWNVILAIGAVLTTVIGFCIAWWVNAVWAEVKTQQAKLTLVEKEISDLRMKLAEGYVPRVELEKTFVRLFDAVEEIRKELAHMSRNQASFKAFQEFLGKDE